jgi:hypothetical protein
MSQILEDIVNKRHAEAILNKDEGQDGHLQLLCQGFDPRLGEKVRKFNTVFKLSL